MARKPSEPRLRSADLSDTQKRQAIELIRRRIAELEAFRPAEMQDQFGSPLKEINTSLAATLTQIFPPETFEHRQFRSVFSVNHGPVTMGDRSRNWVPYVERNRVSTIGELHAVIGSLEEQLEFSAPGVVSAAPEPTPGNRVFIVHGRDDGFKHAVARFLDRLDLDPVILHEQPNAGATIIEKLEAHGDCDFAIVVLTPDDEGRLVGDEPLQPRARQNVIYELGYFVGRLKRKRVAALVAPGLEMPSDFHGVVFIPIDANDAWQMLLGRELKSAGILIDMNKVVGR